MLSVLPPIPPQVALLLHITSSTPLIHIWIKSPHKPASSVLLLNSSTSNVPQCQTPTNIIMSLVGWFDFSASWLAPVFSDILINRFYPWCVTRDSWSTYAILCSLLCLCMVCLLELPRFFSFLSCCLDTISNCIPNPCLVRRYRTTPRIPNPRVWSLFPTTESFSDF